MHTWTPLILWVRDLQLQTIERQFPHNSTHIEVNSTFHMLSEICLNSFIPQKCGATFAPRHQGLGIAHPLPCPEQKQLPSTLISRPLKFLCPKYQISFVSKLYSTLSSCIWFVLHLSPALWVRWDACFEEKPALGIRLVDQRYHLGLNCSCYSLLLSLPSCGLILLSLRMLWGPFVSWACLSHPHFPSLSITLHHFPSLSSHLCPTSLRVHLDA